ncbi:uncharacterized protein LOC110727567 [Chenopodium quinoa]|uniref:CCHC-type domain-containing protein n=1 Tax=Chenopodium quinoa TaxID=63459 RepID=A0A803L292_CHEQI|nr:uncharacterized protein LOC110727567 [Chenopodium quinoa]XP_021762837.1 uncharacterized protein LOC110727567 [Chenopodium quinoa]
MAANNHETKNSETPKLTGKIKWLDSQGIGYILPDNPFLPEVYISPLSLSSNTIKEEDRVKYNTIFNGLNPPHSLEAINVVPIEGKCKFCKKFGHNSSNCPETKISKVMCFRCGIFGHYSMNCDQKYNGWLPNQTHRKNSRPHNRVFSNGGGGVNNVGVWPSLSSVVSVKKEDVKKVEEVEDCFILEFDPTIGNDVDEVKSMVCVKKGEDLKKVEEVEDCFILECDPSELDKFSNLSISQKSDVDDVLILAEKGKVACKDYPHPRHLCATHPFKEGPHDLHCKMCYCYICDIPAPCKRWDESSKCPGVRHCDATDESALWRLHRTLEKNASRGLG